MSDAHESRFFAQAKLIAAWTMVSRVLGLLRESLLAAVFGASWVLDSFYLAFQIPNLFRRLFGEGALSAAFIPVFTEQRETDPRSAWRLASAATTLLLVGLGLITLAGEALLGAWWLAAPDDPERALFCGLAMVMLAFFPAICAVAILGGMLNVLRHFTIPALAPTVLNVFMVAGALLPAERWIDSPHARVWTLAAAVTLAGLVELWMMWAALRRYSTEFGLHWDFSHPGLAKVAAMMGPMVLGLGVLQLMEFANSAVVRGLTAPAADPDAAFSFAGAEWAYPLREGSLTVLQCAQRIYQFPLGVFATALGTAVFPLFSLYAARGDRAGLAAAVAKAVRLSLFIGLPAGVGMVLTAEPMSALLFERGRFTREDTLRTAAVVVWYGAGMWAFCLHAIATRAYYGLKDSTTPMRLGLLLLPLNFALNVTLVWVPGVGVAGISLSTAATFAVTSLLLLWGLRAKLGVGLPMRELALGTFRTAAATAVMAASVWVTMLALPEGSGRFDGKLMHVAVPTGVGIAVFVVTCRLLRMPELGELLRRGKAEAAAAGASVTT